MGVLGGPSAVITWRRLGSSFPPASLALFRGEAAGKEDVACDTCGGGGGAFHGANLGGETTAFGIFTGVVLGVTSEATLAVACEVTSDGKLAVDLMLGLRGGI